MADTLKNEFFAEFVKMIDDYRRQTCPGSHIPLHRSQFADDKSAVTGIFYTELHKALAASNLTELSSEALRMNIATAVNNTSHTCGEISGFTEMVLAITFNIDKWYDELGILQQGPKAADRYIQEVLRQISDADPAYGAEEKMLRLAHIYLMRRSEFEGRPSKGGLLERFGRESVEFAKGNFEQAVADLHPGLGEWERAGKEKTYLTQTSEKYGFPLPESLFP